MPLLSQVRQDILSEIEGKYQATQPAPQEPTKGRGKAKASEPDLEVEALRGEVQKLRQERQNERLTNRLLEIAAQHKVTNPAAFTKLIRAEAGDSLAIEDNGIFVKAGDQVQTLDAYAETFLAGEVGKVLMPASQAQGSGSKEPQQAATPTKQSLDELMMQVFTGK